MRIDQRFTISAPPESVFAYITDPANLRDWQTSKTRVEVLSEGPPQHGFRIREWTKPAVGKEFEQLVEFTEFERPNRLHVHVVEGPYPVDGTWVMSAAGEGTEGGFPRGGSAERIDADGGADLQDRHGPRVLEIPREPAPERRVKDVLVRAVRTAIGMKVT